MKIKKYVAPSMQEAMKKIRVEMGNDAVILNSKEVQNGGFLGLFSKKQIEVIAALDRDVPVKRLDKDKKSLFKEKPFESVSAKIDGLQDKQLSSSHVFGNNQDLLEELKELKGIIQSISAKENSELYPEPLKVILEKMVKQEINPSLRGNVMTELLKYWHGCNGNLTINQLKVKQKELFLKTIKDHEFGGITYQKKYINVIGPTGVGKTTTLAKLAAACVLQQKKRVAFITTDTYRIAAIDQLKTYAKILDVPIEVCYNIDDFKAAKKKLDMYDFIFIDTAGRNFLESQYVKDLQSNIEFNEEMETFLVLSATAKTSDMLEVYKQFSVIPINKLIITKLDETSTRGSLFDVMTKTRKGVAYTTHGQNVPDDIEATSRERIVEQILR